MNYNSVKKNQKLAMKLCFMLNFVSTEILISITVKPVHFQMFPSENLLLKFKFAMPYPALQWIFILFIFFLKIPYLVDGGYWTVMS